MVLFHHGRGEQRGFEAMRASGSHDAAKAAQRRAAVRFLVVGQPIEVPLNLIRSPQPRNEPPLAWGEKGSYTSLR
jgi:hypothetical protein